MKKPNKYIVDLLFSNERIIKEQILKSSDIQIFYEVGDLVCFDKSEGEILSGTIDKLNSKTCSVFAENGQIWTVPYVFLDHIDQSLFHKRESRAKRLLDAAIRARQLMDFHGLRSWSLYFNHAKRLLGKCVYKDQSIFISRYHAVNHRPLQVEDTILHEVAHALAGPGVGHGPKWKDIACRIGATPEARAYEVDKPEKAMKSLLDAKGRFRTGDIVSFRCKHEQFVGRIVRMNPKRAKVECESRRVFAVPYTLLENYNNSQEIW